MRLGTGNFRAERGRTVWQQRGKREGSRRIFRLGGRWAVGGDQPVVRRTAEEGGRVDGSTKARRAPRRG